MRAWWGSREIPRGQAVRWTIGPLELWIAGHASEWRVATRDDPDELDRLAIEGPGDLSPPTDAEVTRFATTATDERISLQPVPADRPIVVRPDPAIAVLPDQTVTFYVSTPSWLEITGGTGTLATLPSRRLSDTWFGASTMDGQLCYASPTAARLQLQDLPVRPGRVRTEIRVRNQGSDRLLLERVQIPAPWLSLFASADNVLWTPTVTVVRKGGEPSAEVTLANRPPAVAGATERLVAARAPGLPNIVVRALGALLAGD